MARWIFLLLCLMESLASDSDSVCPRQCDCKWKRGKESVFCSQTGFYQVPKLFYTGTQVANPFFFQKKTKKHWRSVASQYFFVGNGDVRRLTALIIQSRLKRPRIFLFILQIFFYVVHLRIFLFKNMYLFPFNNKVFFSRKKSKSFA